MQNPYMSVGKRRNVYTHRYACIEWLDACIAWLDPVIEKNTTFEHIATTKTKKVGYVLGYKSFYSRTDIEMSLTRSPLFKERGVQSS